AGPPRDAEPPIPADRREALRAQIAALTELLAGRIPAEVDPQRLFEVDLLDEAACQRRVEVLARRLEAPDEPPPEEAPDERAPADDGGAGDDAGVGGDAGHPSATPARPREEGATDGGPARAGDGGVAPDGALDRDGGVGLGEGAPGRSAPDEEDLAALERTRDRLRLRFLRLPRAERRAVIEAVRDRRRIAAEEEASRADARRATEDAERAQVARRRALDEAARSPSAIVRDLLAERARLETARGELAEWEARLARERQEVARRDAARLQLIHALERRLAEGDLGPTDADARYADLVEILVADRLRLDEALDSLGQPSEAPTFELGVDLSRPLYARLPQRDALLAAVDDFEQRRERLRERERAIEWLRAERLADDVRRLDRLRVALLPRMSDERRETVLGLGAEGLAQAGRELDQIRLMARFWLRRAWHALPDAPAALGALLARTSSRNELFGLFALAIVIAVLWRRREPITTRLRKVVHARAGHRRWTELVRPFWAVVGPLLVPLVVVGLLHAFFAVWGLLSDSIVMALLRVVVLSTAWFFVAVTAVARLFTSRLRHGAGRAVTARRIFNSVRLFLGFVLVVVLMLRLSALLVGEGYLFTVVVDLAWLFALPLVALLVHRWSDDVVEAHAARYPDGFCARALEKKDSKPRRYALTLPAAGQLTVFGATTAFKELALRFEQARRAFAFLFRRRLEKQTEGATPELKVEDLPEELRAAFDGRPCDPSLEIDHFPGLDPIVEKVHEWSEGGPGFAVALVGERGIGKTSWMRALARRAEVGADVWSVPPGLVEPAQVCRWVAEVLDLTPVDDVDGIAEQVEASERRRVLLLDHCQNLVVRCIGGTVALETLVELAARTGPSVVWVCAFSRYTWLYLERARQAQDLFGERVLFEPWPEEKVVAMIQARMAALEIGASFQDLVVDRLEGSALEDAVLRTEGEYLRLLWDYANGNPRVAMHFWLRSLVPAGDGLRVRLFASPDPAALEELHEQSRFLLAAVVLHENLSEEEAARSVGLSRRECAALFAFLAQRGFVVEEADRWRVSTHWYREVIRYLRRRRLLFD
ncbi:MAG TPA: hypothetical protein RMH99_03670, partial [Sandaracinaceae bacterium LLY-WYZ-13_1]|nr:hypothetical protein [Sandaracinaceae bacterium LLY-WYZ-13_1]